MDPDLTKVIEDLAPQVHHIHCRVGYDHGQAYGNDLMCVDWGLGNETIPGRMPLIVERTLAPAGQVGACSHSETP